MLFAAREAEARHFDAPGLPELRLGGLDSAAGRALLEAHAGAALAPEIRDRLIEGTGGNPLALLEQQLTEAQLAGAEPLMDPLPVSARVERSFLARVRSLPEETQTLLLVAAAEDTGVLPTVLRAARQLGAGAESVDAAEEVGLVRVQGGRLEFRHPLVRSAVYQGALHSRRQRAHRALTEALDRESQADRRAWRRRWGARTAGAGTWSRGGRACRRSRDRQIADRPLDRARQDRGGRPCRRRRGRPHLVHRVRSVGGGQRSRLGARSRTARPSPSVGE